MASTHTHDAIFHASALRLVVPPASAVPALPADDDWRAWWDALSALRPRDTAFFDEKLAYWLALYVPDDALDAGASAEPPADLLRFIARLQLTMTASLLPQQTRPAPPSSTLQPPAPASASASLAPYPPRTPVSAAAPGLAPVTPNPFPAMAAAEEDYAHVEGVGVWEGAVGDGRPRVIRVREGWAVVCRGEVPIVYARTSINNPVLALTASTTLRDAPAKRRRGSVTSIHSAATHDAPDPAPGDDTDDVATPSLAAVPEPDMLGGLAPSPVPASRLSASLRAELFLGPAEPGACVPSPNPSIASTLTATPLPPPAPPAQESTALRRAFRRVLAISPGLRVRMRTLFLPQLLGAADAHAPDAPAERRVVLSVEIEAAEPAVWFQVDGVAVDVGGKGGKASAELVCQPGGGGGGEPGDGGTDTGTRTETDGPVFPIRLAPGEQYNLLYALSIAAGEAGAMDEAIARSTGRGDDQRPVSIALTGRPYLEPATAGEPREYPTAAFSSRWNCTLDLAPFYASMPAPPAAAPRLRDSHEPAIAGDRRYSLATLLMDRGERQHQQQQQHQQHQHQQQQQQQRRILSSRPLPPSTNFSRVASTRGPGFLPPSRPDGHGLLVSFRVIPPPRAPPSAALAAAAPVPADTILPLETFALEVFVNNRTEAVKRFHLSVPPHDAHGPGAGAVAGASAGVGAGAGANARLIEAWRERRRRADWVADDALVRALGARDAARAPPLVSLETDVRCGPLLPGASLAARIRFLALRPGAHTIDRLRIAGDDFEYTVQGVADVVVGDGKA
ncbi:hypothetical protein Q5752_000667 [Cryptotrichosporon argae]